jgi:diguanylate cyclase (GGDEF)-like protein
MNLSYALLLLVTHGIPILFFTYMATDVLLRNRKSIQHILLGFISLCYLLLFAEEYVRNQVPIEYSPILSSMWLSSVGILIPGLCFHFLIKFTRLDRHLPRFIYPYVFYLPVIFVIINIATGAKFISAQQFLELGLWKVPVYNTGYFIAMTASIVTDMLYLIPLLIAKAKSELQEHKSIYNQLVFGIVISIIWHCLFGYINYGSTLPPYPYLYSGIIWCYFLRRTMKMHDFLNLYDKRFEKLFNMNPDAILLADRHLVVKHANPSAMQMFESLQLSFERLSEWMEPALTANIAAAKKISDHEIDLSYPNRRLVMLVNADYVWIDNELHALLILRDITAQKVQQEEITFLAYHDPLTRMPNRRYFYEKLDESLVHAERNGNTLALLLIDIDKFKLLNDTHGHLAGDETLQQIAIILQEARGESGFAARMGGDEFVMYIASSPSKQDAEVIVEQIQQRFAQYIAKYGLTSVDLSMGISFYPEDGTEGQALINAADNAMYEMKRSVNH